MANIPTPDTTDIRSRTNALVDRALDHLVAHDMQGYADLFASDGRIEFPFGASDFPQHIDGRAAISAYLAHYTEIVDVREIVSQVRHQTDDPGTVVLEFVTSGVAVATQNPFVMPYIAVITVGVDGIVTYRDYWSPMKAAEAVGATDLRDDTLGGAR